VVSTVKGEWWEWAVKALPDEEITTCCPSSRRAARLSEPVSASANRPPAHPPRPARGCRPASSKHRFHHFTHDLDHDGRLVGQVQESQLTGDMRVTMRRTRPAQSPPSIQSKHKECFHALIYINFMTTSSR